MKVIIEIECNNDAFVPNWTSEVERILVKFANRIHAQSHTHTSTLDTLDLDGYKLKDINGNTVGTAKVIYDE